LIYTCQIWMVASTWASNHCQAISFFQTSLRFLTYFSQCLPSQVSRSALMCLLPCFAGSAFTFWKVKRSVSKAFGDSAPSEPTEPVESAVVTELKLNLSLAKAKSGVSRTPTLERAPSTRKVSQKEADSKARLQALIDQNKSASRK
jgi:hypothetical protein